MEVLKEIFDSMSARVKTPFWGYAFFTNIYLNWKTYYIVLFTDENYGKKFMYFDDHTSIYSLLVIPFLVGVILAVASPWLRSRLERMVVGAKNLSMRTQVESEELVIVKRLELQEKQKKYEDNQADIAKARAESAEAVLREQEAKEAQANKYKPAVLGDSFSKNNDNDQTDEEINEVSRD